MNNRIEAVVRRLFSDGKFREEASKDPVAVLGQYELSEVEMRSLNKLCKSLVPAGRPTVSRGVILSWL